MKKRMKLAVSFLFIVFITSLISTCFAQTPELVPYFNGESGSVAIDLKYDAANSFQNGVASVELNNTWGLIDREGNLLTEIKS